MSDAIKKIAELSAKLRNECSVADPAGWQEMSERWEARYALAKAENEFLRQRLTTLKQSLVNMCLSLYKLDDAIQELATETPPKQETHTVKDHPNVKCFCRHMGHEHGCECKGCAPGLHHIV